jgi:hypothetical protein
MTDKTLTYQLDDLLAHNGALLYDRAGSAAYAAYGRLEWHLDGDFGDARQAAAAAYWQAHRRNPLDRYAWSAARYDALSALLHNSVRAVSLDAPDNDGSDDPWIENIPAPTDDDGDDDPHWLDAYDLHGLVARLLARPSESAVTYQSAILRLLCAGYDTAAIATDLGRTEEGIKSTRAKIRKRLFAYCAQHSIDTSHIQIQNGGWRPAHHYANMDNTAANAARWHGGSHD